jgi:hypothetical protein
LTNPPIVHHVVAGLTRSEIAGVNPHTLAVALARVEAANTPFERVNERQAAILLLERIGYPETVAELSTFLNLGHALTPTDLPDGEITAQRAVSYMRWLAAFLNDPEPNIQKNARILLRWLVANRREIVAADQTALEPMRHVADDMETGAKSSAFLVYALGGCGTPEDYDRVLRHAELVIEHDREHLDLVADGLYRLYPPALINALQYFLEHTQPGEKKQFMTGLHLLSKVAEIEDRGFWQTYYTDMEGILEQLTEMAGNNHAIERILDLIEKHLAFSTFEDE